MRVARAMSENSPRDPVQSGTRGHIKAQNSQAGTTPNRPRRAHLLTPTLLVRFSFAIDLLLGAILFYRAWEKPDPIRIIVIFLILEAVFVLFYLPVWWKIRRRNDMAAHLSGAAYCLLRLYAVVTGVVWMIA
jgi:hypothetical protein